MVTLPDPFQNLSDEQKILADRLSQNRGQLQGLYKTLLHHPKLTERVSTLGDFARFEGVLTSRQKEVVILSTARALGARFVWQQHEGPARKAGTPEQTIEALRIEQEPADAEDRAFSEVARGVVADQVLGEDLFKEICDIAGIEGCIEAVTISGFYRMIYAVIVSFEVALPKPDLATF